MSVDYYHCENCGESRYEEYVGYCNKCDTRLCTSCLINNDINSSYAYEYGYKYDSSDTELMEKYKDEGFDLFDKDGKPYYEDGDIIGDSNIDSKYCPYCSGDAINNEELFNFLVEKYKIDINKEWKEYKDK